MPLANATTDALQRLVQGFVQSIAVEPRVPMVGHVSQKVPHHVVLRRESVLWAHRLHVPPVAIEALLGAGVVLNALFLVFALTHSLTHSLAASVHNVNVVAVHVPLSGSVSDVVTHCWSATVRHWATGFQLSWCLSYLKVGVRTSCCRGVDVTCMQTLGMYAC